VEYPSITLTIFVSVHRFLIFPTFVSSTTLTRSSSGSCPYEMSVIWTRIYPTHYPLARAVRHINTPESAALLRGGGKQSLVDISRGKLFNVFGERRLGTSSFSVLLKSYPSTGKCGLTSWLSGECVGISYSCKGASEFVKLVTGTRSYIEPVGIHQLLRQYIFLKG
jgi:hypothetical protein